MGKVYGCWVENPLKFKVKYPLTKANSKRATVFAVSVVAGEYIQHLCDRGNPHAGRDAVAEVAAATTVVKRDNRSWNRERWKELAPTVYSARGCWWRRLPLVGPAPPWHSRGGLLLWCDRLWLHVHVERWKTLHSSG